MSETEEARLPLFPLGVVLLPGMRLPLHIFEERYKQMIGNCIAHNAPFVLAYYDGRDPRRVACTAVVTDVLQRYPDGRLDIMCLGDEKVEITEIVDEKSYLEAHYRLVVDDPAGATQANQQTAETGIGYLREMEVILGETHDHRDLADLDLSSLSFRLAAAAGFTPEEKQRFLEMGSASQRLDKVVQALGQALDRLRIAASIKRIIGGNGHIAGIFSQGGS